MRFETLLLVGSLMIGSAPAWSEDAPAAPAPAAESQCAPLPKVLEMLAKKFGEHPIAEGKTGDNKSVVVLSTPDRKAFAIIATGAGPDGVPIGCIVSVGTTWSRIANYKVEEQF